MARDLVDRMIMLKKKEIKSHWSKSLLESRKYGNKKITAEHHILYIACNTDMDTNTDILREKLKKAFPTKLLTDTDVYHVLKDKNSQPVMEKTPYYKLRLHLKALLNKLSPVKIERRSDSYFYLRRIKIFTKDIEELLEPFGRYMSYGDVYDERDRLKIIYNELGGSPYG